MAKPTTDRIDGNISDATTVGPDRGETGGRPAGDRRLRDGLGRRLTGVDGRFLGQVEFDPHHAFMA